MEKEDIQIDHGERDEDVHDKEIIINVGQEKLKGIQDSKKPIISKNKGNDYSACNILTDSDRGSYHQYDGGNLYDRPNLRQCSDSTGRYYAQHYDMSE